MKPHDIALARSIERQLRSFSLRPLHGIQAPEVRDCLIRQLVDSTRRIKYVQTIAARPLTAAVADASSIAFDPLKAAVWHFRQQNIDEAFWLVFLATHFGKNKRTGWQLLQAVYGGLGNPHFWTWAKTSANPAAFCDWLKLHRDTLKTRGAFGNHRKYESLVANTSSGTGETITSYVEWVGPSHSHLSVISAAQSQVGNNPRAVFNFLYHSMASVSRFGRTAKFDYLTMLGKIGLADVEPDSTYMHGATGPLLGARLLFEGDKNALLSPTVLSNALVSLEAHLGLYFGMQVLEDALCNWQKFPSEYIHFRG